MVRQDLAARRAAGEIMIRDRLKRAKREVAVAKPTIKVTINGVAPMIRDTNSRNPKKSNTATAVVRPRASPEETSAI